MRRALVFCLFSYLTATIGLGQAAPSPSPASIATNEVLRRQQMLKKAQDLIEAGALAQSDRSYGEAMDRFKAAFELLPEAPAVEATRRIVFRRYQSATVQYAQQMIDAARWPQAKHVLEVALELGETARMGSSMDPGLKRMLANLNDPDYYATAISPQHLKNVQRVKELLIIGKGYLDYGDYDRAIRSFHQVLQIDPYNSAARRSIEEVERHKLNYYEVSKDQARATRLREIAEEWEMPVPKTIGVDSPLVAPTLPTSRRASLEEKLQTIVMPSLEVDQARLADVLFLLNQRSVELDFNESDVSLKGINLVLDSGSFAPGENPGEKTLTLRLTNVPIGVALKYVTQKTGTSYVVDNFAVRIVSKAAGAQRVIENRTWIVPPGFLNRGDGGNDPLDNDPFAAPSGQGGVEGILVKRKTAKEFLEDSGVTFPEGTLATYNPKASTLMVRNTPDQLALVDNLVQSAREGVNKMVEVSLKMISVSQDRVKQLGIDSLLGQANIGSSPRVFGGGGTTGGDGSFGDTPFINPGTGTPIGTFPLSSGLRVGDLQTTTSIDDVINRGQGSALNTSAPAVFSVAGVFTDPQFQAILRMFTQTKGVDYLCDTKLLVRPGQRGKVEVIREFIYPTEYDPPEIPNNVNNNNGNNGGRGGGQSPITPANPTAFDMRPLGKMVEVEPVVSDDNHTVSLNVLLEMSEFSGFINYGTPITTTVVGFTGAPETVTVSENRILMPVFDVVRETTNVSVWDGATVAIGGFFGHNVTDSQDKIPFLGDLPGVGKMFRSSTENHVKQALMIFASVRIIDPGGVPINQVADENDANEFPPRSNRPAPAAAPSFFPPPATYQK